MEQVLLDLGAFVRDARERLGYRRIILAGWSGGGSVALTYQSQAEHPTITRTPSGEPCDLAGADLIPADGLLLLAAHEGRHRVLTESLDASIIDELNPDRRESDLNLYDRQNGPTAPYSADFLASYRSKQRDRNRRITAWVRDVLEDLNRQGRPQAERCFVVHGTMADPRWLDPSIEPNDRPPNKCFLGDPELVNTGPTGLARFSCLRSWLSQWSLDDAQVDSVKSAPGVTVPVLMVGHSADEAVPTSHTKAVFDALGQKDKQLWTITGADHYLGGPDQRRNADEVVNIATHWMAERDFAEASPESERQLI
jgi:pimeloyl-ACP methyl ester carboxylesterase